MDADPGAGGAVRHARDRHDHGIGRTYIARLFDFRGAGELAKFGGLMAAGQFFWVLQSQADVFIAGRVLDPATLGLYTTGLFLTQILVSKFVPAINDVAFSIYARMQDNRDAVARRVSRARRGW